MSTATKARPVAAPRKVQRIQFARSIEASVSGEAPEAARLWRAGWNKTDKGDLNFTPRSAELVIAAWEKRGNPLVWYYEHEDRIPLDKRGGAPMKGAASAPSSDLAIRESEDGPECWAEGIAWTAEAKRQITTGERRQLSPIAAFDSETREIVEILNVSLCAEGATHFGTILASAGKVTDMDDLITRALAAIAAGDYTTLSALADEAAGMPGAEAVGAILKAICTENAKEPAEPMMDDAATTKLAAGIASLMAGRKSPQLAAARPATQGIPEAFARELTAARLEGSTALHEARTGRVEGLIAANRDLFDAADERQHIKRADPEATREYVDSMKRKQTAGTVTLAASRISPVNAPRVAPPAKEDVDDLNELEADLAKKSGVTPEAMKAAKARTRVASRNGAGRR